MRIDAFLCDSASVRENLLFVLGGGITRIRRPRFPAELDVSIAMMISLTPSEAATKHVFRVSISGVDGEPIAEIDGEFSAQRGDDSLPGELIQVPVALPLRRISIPSPGSYAVNVLIDNQEKASLALVAQLAS